MQRLGTEAIRTQIQPSMVNLFVFSYRVQSIWNDTDMLDLGFCIGFKIIQVMLMCFCILFSDPRWILYRVQDNSSYADVFLYSILRPEMDFVSGSR